jgi:hypothetical protein
VRYTCSVCGRISDERRCEQHRTRRLTPDGWSRDSWAQQKFRDAVLARDAHCCMRCGATEDLQAAHHPKPLREFDVDDPMRFDPRSGITLCRTCHKRLDPYAR